MSQTTTLILLPQTVYAIGANAAPYTVVGEKRPAAAFYLGNKDLQTVNISTAALSGNVVIEASLATSPTEEDWFDVYQLTANVNAMNNTAPKLASTTSVGVNIEGNFVWLRAKIEDFSAGGLQYAKVSY